VFKPFFYWITGKELKNEEKKSQHNCERAEGNKNPEENAVKPATKPDGGLRLTLYCFIIIVEKLHFRARDNCTTTGS